MTPDSLNPVYVLYVVVAVLVLVLVAINERMNVPGYPTSTADCPPGQVYVDWGETPQPGCVPEGVARNLNIYPKPEAP